jgi:hypothetical protein
MALSPKTVIFSSNGSVIMNGSQNQLKPSIYRAPWAVVIATALTAILYLVPFLYPLAYPFILISTLFHEMGHGIAAVLVGGHFDSFNMWADGSGVAHIAGDFGSLSRAFIAAAGLLGPAIGAAFFFCFVNKNKSSRYVLAALGIALVLALLLVVRNVFGLVFIAALIALSFFFSLGSGARYANIVLAFLASQLALSVFSRSDYLFTPWAITSAGPMPSDVAQIADALFFPYWFWGILIAIASLAVLAFGFKRIFR